MVSVLFLVDISLHDTIGGSLIIVPLGQSQKSSLKMSLCAIDKISVDRVKIAVFVIQKSSVRAIPSLTLANNLWHQACWQTGKLVRHWGRQQTSVTGSNRKQSWIIKFTAGKK